MTATSQIVENPPSIVIQPSKGWIALNLGSVWAYRELLFFLARRDVSVRYKQTILGAAWAVVQPLFYMVIFSVIFGGLADIPSDGLPYPIFSFTALLPWQYFATALTSSSQSLVGDQGLITKVYFPRLIIPFASVLPAIIDFLIAFLILIGMMIFYQITPTLNLLWLPLFLLLALGTALGSGLWLSALNIQYRDIRYVVPFMIQLWFYASPIAYPSSMIPDRWQVLYGLNPMAGVIEGFRWALLGNGTPPGPMLAISALASAILLVTGAYYFRRMERTFADLV